jgi:hypothetical protein
MPEDNQNPTIQPNEETTDTSPMTNEDELPSRASLTGQDQGAGLAPALDASPEAQGEVNGGPLGCCLGVFIGLMVSLPIAVIGRLYANPLVPVFHSALLVLILLRILMAIGAIAGAIIFGYFGWKIGKKLYREYEPPVIPIREQKLPKRNVARNKVKHSTRG